MVGLVPESLGEAYINQHVALARPLSAICPTYIAYYLCASEGGWGHLKKLQRGATKVALGLVRHVFYNKDGSRNAQEFRELRGEFDDPRVIEMYELAADSNGKKPWSQRVNHWVHEYHYDFEALDYISAQFSNPQRVAGYLNPQKT